MRSYKSRAIIKSFLPDLFSALLVFCYAAFSTRLPFQQMLFAFFRILAVALSFQFILAPITDHLAYSKMSKLVDHFYTSETTVQERTRIFEKLMHYPFYCALMTFGYFFLGSIILLRHLIIELNVPANISTLFAVETFFGTIIASISGYFSHYTLCRSIASDIVAAGIEKDYVMRKKFFGTKVATQMFIFIAIPTFFTLLINALVVIIGYYPGSKLGYGEKSDIQMQRMLWTCIFNLAVNFWTLAMFYFNTDRKNQQMKQALRNMEKSDFSNTKLIRTDISDEFAYNQYLANQMIILFRNILSQTANFGNTISHSAADLTRISNETESTSVEQSTGTKEIVSTMENATNLSHDIENRISEVTELAKETVKNVSTGSDLLEKALESMKSIAESNEITILGIKQLTDKIKSIWEIANIIDSISDQTKIIAFNAELEATTASGERKNFKNVSNEIRRLANNTMDSTREIKARISEIQEASLSLIRASEESTVLIKKGTTLAVGLEDKFTNIRNSAKSNSNSANEIQYLVEQQTSAFDQIVKTLQQISTSIQEFSISTRTLIDTSKSLEGNVGKLESMNLSNSDSVTGEENE